MFTTPKIKDLYNKPLDRYEELITSYNSNVLNEKNNNNDNYKDMHCELSNFLNNIKDKNNKNNNLNEYNNTIGYNDNISNNYFNLQ